MIPFLDNIADRLLQKFPDNMQDVAIVLPSKRSAIFLKHYLSKKIKKPIFLPDFFSIEEFTEHLSGLQVIDNISLQFRLFQTYLRYPPKKKDTFDDFLKWSNVLLHDFNEIDRNLVDARSIYTNLKDVKELENWSIEDWSFAYTDLTHIQRDYLSFFEGMLDWYYDFRESLLADSLAFQGMAYKQAAENIKYAEIKWDKIWFVGLNALTNSEKKIIDYLKKEDVARVFWDADRFYYDNPLHEAGSFLRGQREKWSEIDFKGVGEYYKQSKESFNVIACPKNISQAKVASEILKDLPKVELDDSNTALVLADEALLYPVLHNLPSKVKQLNVTMGSPLKNTALFAFVESVLNMQINAIKYKKRAFYYKDIINVVEHPYFIKIVGQKEVFDFKRFVVSNNIIFINKDNIKESFSSDFINQLFTIWDAIDDALETLVLLIEKLKGFLVGKLGTIESEVLTTFYRVIIILKKLLDENNFNIEFTTIQVIMKQLVSKETIPFKGEPLKGVQLMGILESRTLDFKNVILLGVNEGKLPKGKSVNSFIPYDLKKYFKLPTYAESDAVFSYHFYRLLQRSNNVNLIYNSETDDFGSGEKSRFITQLLSEYDGDIKEYVYQGGNLEVQSANQIVIQNKGLENEIGLWAKKGVSPSALNKYNNCSLQFYYHYLAGIRRDNEVDEYVDASIMGTAIHDSLDANYPLGILTEKSIDEKISTIINDIEKAFIELISNEGMKEGKNYLNLQIAKKLTKDFLKVEKKLIKNANKIGQQIKLISKEEVLSHQLKVCDIDFKLTGKVDRVDFEGDSLRIIDYKTGNVQQDEVTFSEFDELIDNPKKSKAFQLMMYAYMYLRMHPNYISLDVFAGNYSFKNLQEGLIKVSKKTRNKKEVLNINADVLDAFEIQLNKILNKILNNDFEQTTDLKNCEWCDYKAICKR
ncbi:MAG: hypothetical protein CMD16_00375 [Flavobacteriales bacterium]|nr:hypothetical protein [Flavobacteriales bacterium]